MDTNFKIADASELAKQQKYADGLAAEGFDFGLTVGSAFVESMRNTRYTTESAFDEIIDNSIEAGATAVHIALGYGKDSEKKPDSIAIIDNGHGMPRNMVRLAVLWGGTHREGARSGFGRFGFGLPSAAVSQGRRYSVYSKVKGQEWHGVTIDLDEIGRGTYTSNGRIVAPQVQQSSPPKWVEDYIEKNYAVDNFKAGTVVLLEKLDKAPKTAAGIRKNLSEHIGVVYRNYFQGTQFYVDGDGVSPTDPLFVTPGFRYHSIEGDAQQATPMEPAEFEVAPKDGGAKVRVRVRYARFPLGFLATDKAKKADKSNKNPRWDIKAETMGLIVNRMGRQIDVLNRTPWQNLERLTTNNDRLWAAEIDFPAELDEEFHVSNDKQGAWPSDRMWVLLKEAGVENAIRQLRHSIETDQDAKRTATKPGDTRPSEKTMEEAQKFKRKRVEADPDERDRAAKDALERFVKRRAEETQRPEEQVRQEVEKEFVKHPYRVEFERLPGAPFFRVEQVGGMRVLFLNRAHRFHSDIYAKETNRHFQAALEVLLFTIGECELDAQGNPDRRTFYASERHEWSQLLTSALDVLSRYEQDTQLPGDENQDVAA